MSIWDIGFVRRASSFLKRLDSTVELRAITVNADSLTNREAVNRHRRPVLSSTGYGYSSYHPVTSYRSSTQPLLDVLGYSRLPDRVQVRIDDMKTPTTSGRNTVWCDPTSSNAPIPVVEDRYRNTKKQNRITRSSNHL